MLIGNECDWDYYSFAPATVLKSLRGGALGAKVNTIDETMGYHIDTLDMETLAKNDSDGYNYLNRYEWFIRFKTTKSQDDSARAKAATWTGDLWSNNHNCVDMSLDAMRAAGIPTKRGTMVASVLKEGARSTSSSVLYEIGLSLRVSVAVTDVALDIASIPTSGARLDMPGKRAADFLGISSPLRTYSLNRKIAGVSCSGNWHNYLDKFTFREDRAVGGISGGDF